MAAMNSLTYLVYSLLTLAGNNNRTTDPPLNALQNSSESQVTKTWNQDYDTSKFQHLAEQYPDHTFGTTKHDEESCPNGETWSDCDAGCQETCETVGKPQICLRMCIPGCVCEEPGTVRGPDNKCIHPPLCAPDSRIQSLAEQDPDHISRATKDSRTQSLSEQDPDHMFRATKNSRIETLAEQDPDYVSRAIKHSRIQSLAEQDPDHISRATKQSRIQSLAEQDPDHIFRATKHSRIQSLAKQDSDHTFSATKHSRIQSLAEQDPDHISRATKHSRIHSLFEQDPDHISRATKHDEESCPNGETWSDCDAGCQETCETVGKPHICPRMCIPGCVCEEPGTVRGPDNKCIHPPLCAPAESIQPLAERDSVRTRYHMRAPVTKQRKMFGFTVDSDERVRAEQNPVTARVDPDEMVGAEQDPVTSRVDPGDEVRADQNPDIRSKIFYDGGCPEYLACSLHCRRLGWNQGVCTGPTGTFCNCFGGKDSVDPNIPGVYPDETIRAEQDPYHSRVEPSRANIFWPAEQDPDVSRIDPDETVGAEQDPDIRRVDPDEQVRAEQDIDIRKIYPDVHVRAEQDPDVTTDIDPRCPPNKVYRKCDSGTCIQECVCKPGFVEGRYGSCIKPQ